MQESGVLPANQRLSAGAHLAGSVRGRGPVAAENDREFIFGPDDSVDGELAQADTQHEQGVENLHHGVRSTALHLARGNPRGGALLVAGGVLLAAGIAGFLSGRDTLILVATSSVLLGAAALAYGVRVVRRDTARAAGELVEEREERRRIAAGVDLPMLQVRHLDFSYGQVQVLFDVNLDVRQGEVLALLGTNGAGKSTLLRAISGLGVADRGTVRFAGQQVTFTEPRDRVRLGIVQVPGGNAVFRSLSVRDNLLSGAYTFIWDQKRVVKRVDAVLELFPVLEERLEQRAGTLSGGEQQMLGLAMGLLLEPKLLLIDELSLGLAPVVVQQLLDIVERLKERGLTMVIVEQSINVALAVADRAVFMERGQVRFEGPAVDLLDRDDLVRAVFLGSEGG